MFGDTLLESSPTRPSLLEKRHYFYAAGGGATGSLVWFFALGRLLSAGPSGAMALQSLVIGSVTTVLGLMLCYVHAESRGLGLNTPFWVTLTCLLNLPGFVCFLVYTATKTGNWKRAAIPCVYGVEGLLVGAMALVPLVYTEALPKTVWTEVLQVPVPPPPPRAPLATQTVRQAMRPSRPEHTLLEPTSIPAHIAPVHDEYLPPAQFPSASIGVPGGISDGLPGGALDPALQKLLSSAGPQPPAPQAPKPVQQQRIRLGGIVVAAKLIYQPKPDYPELARMTRTPGDVEFEAIIGKEGSIEELKVVRGHPLLVKAAFEAVRQWRYQPTLLNGEPVEVLTEITVTFRLGE
jgi:periplasmic protein TonB